MKITRLAIVSTDKPAISETFIAAHLNHLNPEAFFYGGKIPLRRNDKLLQSFALRGVRRFIGELKGNPHWHDATAFKRALKSNKIDIILAEYGTVGADILDICRSLQIKLIVHFHGFDASRYDTLKAYRHLYKEMFAYASSIIVVSQEMKLDLIMHGCPEDKILNNPYGPDEKYFEIIPKYETQGIVSVGRFVDKKAPYYLILAFQRIVKKHPTASLKMIGEGPLRPICENLVRYFRLEDKITFLGAQNSESIVDFFANSSASIGILVAKVLRMKTIIYSYEPHSEFQVELGIWGRNSLKYKVLSSLERYAGKHADYIMTGTKHMVERLIKEKTKAKVFRAPTSVDPEQFKFRPIGRSRIRNHLSIEEDVSVFLYVGKFGGLYYREEIALLCSGIKSFIPKSFFIIVTSNDHSEIDEMFSQRLSKQDYYITGKLSYDDLKDYISASDVGLSGVPPTPSQLYRSPTKVAEYLLCGLPYITTKGVSEDDEIALEKNVGVVLERFGSVNLKDDVKSNLVGIFHEDKVSLRRRCREVGLEYRSKEKIDGILENIYKSDSIEVLQCST